MTLTTDQIKQLEVVSRPLVKWMNENCHPHCEVTVTQCSIEVKEGLATVINKVED